MDTTIDRKRFLQEETIALLKTLPTDREPNFGLMSPQLMAEHLAMVVKTSIKRYGEPSDPPAEKEVKFKQWIAKGAVFKHRPSDKTKADLPEFKYSSMEEAIEQVSVGLKRFYDHFEANPAFKPYNPFFGELSFAELEHFHYMHYRYHLWQFGLLEEYP